MKKGSPEWNSLAITKKPKGSSSTYEATVRMGRRRCGPLLKKTATASVRLVFSILLTKNCPGTCKILMSESRGTAHEVYTHFVEFQVTRGDVQIVANS